MATFWLCFVPLFVAVDAVGLLPVYLSLTEGMSKTERDGTLRQSLLTALLVAVTFVFAGQALFRWLGISVQDFMIAGGILLLAFAMRDLLTMEKSIPQASRHAVGAVPIGVPLMVGPAVLTTSILLVDQHGYLLTLAAIFMNILIAGIAFSCSQGINRLLGLTGVRTVSKVISVILAAYGVMMVRRGCLSILENLSQSAT